MSERRSSSIASEENSKRPSLCQRMSKAVYATGRKDSVEKPDKEIDVIDSSNQSDHGLWLSSEWLENYKNQVPQIKRKYNVNAGLVYRLLLHSKAVNTVRTKLERLPIA